MKDYFQRALKYISKASFNMHFDIDTLFVAVILKGVAMKALFAGVGSSKQCQKYNPQSMRDFEVRVNLDVHL